MVLMNNASATIQTNVSGRNNRIDYIRALCSLLVIIAHVNPPALLNNIRAFDVVSLVFVSGMSLSMGRERPYSEYILGRLKKLLLPTYAILTIVFAGSYTACKVLNISQLYSSNQIIRSFLLITDGSMGYVWIVRIYLIIAFATPLIKKAGNNIQDEKHFWIALLLCFTVTFVLYLVYVVVPEGPILNIYSDFIYSGFVYIIIAFMGYWLVRNFNRGGYSKDIYFLPGLVLYCVK